MGSDFSALDAELDTLETGPSVDSLALAHRYAGSAAGSSLELHVVDAALNEIDADGKLLRTRSSFPPEVSRRRSEPSVALRSHAEEPRASTAREHTSEEIVLPDPVPREPQRRDPGSGEMPLRAASAPLSGSFSLEQSAPNKTFKHNGRDDTLEPFDDELVEADEELIEFTAATPSANDTGAERRRSSLFAPPTVADDVAQAEADAAFAELFSEATRQSSSLPATRNSQIPETYNDDTETFDSSALGFIENDTAAADGSMDEELDSAEFEIVVDGDASKATPPASDGPEKRPSFLGRLFGRKDE